MKYPSLWESWINQNLNLRGLIGCHLLFWLIETRGQHKVFNIYRCTCALWCLQWPVSFFDLIPIHSWGSGASSGDIDYHWEIKSQSPKTTEKPLIDAIQVHQVHRKQMAQLFRQPLTRTFYRKDSGNCSWLLCIFRSSYDLHKSCVLYTISHWVFVFGLQILLKIKVTCCFFFKVYNTFWHVFLFPFLEPTILRFSLRDEDAQSHDFPSTSLQRPTVLPRLSELHGHVPANTPGGLGDEASL